MFFLLSFFLFFFFFFFFCVLFFSPFFFFSSRRPHTRLVSDWSSDVCSSDLAHHRWRQAGAERSGDALRRAGGRSVGDIRADRVESVGGRRRLPAAGWPAAGDRRSEERRVGKECRTRWPAQQ